jgi:hypothetical protein
MRKEGNNALITEGHISLIKIKITMTSNSQICVSYSYITTIIQI